MKHDQPNSSVVSSRLVRPSRAGAYARADWTKRNSDLARELGVSRQAVTRARPRYTDVKPVRSPRLVKASARRRLEILWLLEAGEISSSLARQLCGFCHMEELESFRAKLRRGLLRTLPNK
jgi:hypothetical protein